MTSLLLSGAGGGASLAPVAPTVTAMGVNQAASGGLSTLTVTVSSTAAVGDYVFVEAASNNSIAAISITDSKMHTWTAGPTTDSGVLRLRTWWTVVTSSMVSATDTVTVTFTNATPIKLMSVVCLKNIVAHDADLGGQASSGTALSMTLPASTYGNRVVMTTRASDNPVGYTSDPDITSVQSAGVSNRSLRTGYVLMPTNASLTIDDSQTSGQWAGAMTSFRGN